MIYIATTTINKPTKALKKFANNNNCKLIVALDKKSKPFKLKNSIVLSTEYQNKKWPKPRQKSIFYESANVLKSRNLLYLVTDQKKN